MSKRRKDGRREERTVWDKRTEGWKDQGLDEQRNGRTEGWRGGAPGEGEIVARGRRDRTTLVLKDTRIEGWKYNDKRMC